MFIYALPMNASGEQSSVVKRHFHETSAWRAASKRRECVHDLCADFLHAVSWIDLHVNVTLFPSENVDAPGLERVGLESCWRKTLSRARPSERIFFSRSFVLELSVKSASTAKPTRQSSSACFADKTCAQLVVQCMITRTSTIVMNCISRKSTVLRTKTPVHDVNEDYNACSHGHHPP